MEEKRRSGLASGAHDLLRHTWDSDLGSGNGIARLEAPRNVGMGTEKRKKKRRTRTYAHAHALTYPPTHTHTHTNELYTDREGLK